MYLSVFGMASRPVCDFDGDEAIVISRSVGHGKSPARFIAAVESVATHRNGYDEEDENQKTNRGEANLVPMKAGLTRIATEPLWISTVRIANVDLAPAPFTRHVAHDEDIQ